MRYTALLLVAAFACVVGGCITWTDKSDGTSRRLILPTLSVSTDRKTPTETYHGVVVLPIVSSSKKSDGADGTYSRKVLIAPLATASERSMGSDGIKRRLFVSVPLLTVSHGWENPETKEYYSKTQCAVILYGSERYFENGVSSRTWYVTPLFRYSRVGERKEFRLFFIPIPLSRGKTVPPPE